MTSPDEIITRQKGVDIFVYSGNLTRGGANRLITTAEQIPIKRPNVALLLCTLGGDPDAAYLIARYLRREYSTFHLYVFGHCKSAGTLIALGAHKIVMSARGEFGPIDIQMMKSDELLRRSSGLVVSQALDYLNDYAFKIFQQQFYQLIITSGGAISTKTAADIAASITVGLLSPITEQIDPIKAGEMARAVKIVSEYGQKLGASSDKINALTRNYSSHTFVIDFEEAREIFGDDVISPPDENDLALEQFLHELLDAQSGQEMLYEPSVEVTVIHINPMKLEQSAEEEGANDNENTITEIHSQTFAVASSRREVDGNIPTERSGAV
jgi:hypothetical protein